MLLFRTLTMASIIGSGSTAGIAALDTKAEKASGRAKSGKVFKSKSFKDGKVFKTHKTKGSVGPASVVWDGSTASKTTSSLRPVAWGKKSESETKTSIKSPSTDPDDATSQGTGDSLLEDESSSSTAPTRFRLVANDDFVLTSQGSSVALFVLSNDTFPEDVSGSMTDPGNGIVSKEQSSLVYSPNDGFCGIDTFKYTLTDGEVFDTATVTIDVLCDASQEETAGPPLTTSATLAGDVTASSTTSLPAEIGKATDSFSDDEASNVGVNESTAFPAPATMVPTTNGVQILLQVEDDFAQGNLNQELYIPALANDVIPQGAQGSFKYPQHGKIVEATAEGLLYMPNADFCGHDSFAYEITVGEELSDSANVTIHILCDDAQEETAGPMENEDGITPFTTPATMVSTTEEVQIVLKLENDFAQGNKNQELHIPIMANDVIPQGSQGSFKHPQHGKIVEPTAEGLIYMPDADFCGYDSFVYEITVEEELSDLAYVTIHILCDDAQEETAGPMENVDGITPFPTHATMVPTSDNVKESNGTLSLAVDGEGDKIVTSPAQILNTIGEGFTDGTISTSSSTSPSTAKTQILNLVDDFAEGIMNEALAIELLSNDIIPPNSQASFNPPKHGQITEPTHNGIIYMPDTDFCGYDFFQYDITVGEELSGSAYVTVHILCNGTAQKLTALNDTITIVNNSDTPGFEPDELLASPAQSGERWDDQTNVYLQRVVSSKLVMAAGGVVGAILVMAGILALLRPKKRAKPWCFDASTGSSMGSDTSSLTATSPTIEQSGNMQERLQKYDIEKGGKKIHIDMDRLALVGSAGSGVMSCSDCIDDEVVFQLPVEQR